MTNRTNAGVLVLALATGLAGCDGANSPAPTAPSVAQAPVPSSAPTRTPTPWPPGVLSAYTLSGVVLEVTTTGERPIEGVAVYCELCGEATHSWAFTDRTGFYSFTGVWTTPGARTPVWFSKEGYVDPPGVPRLVGESGYRQVLVDGDTRFDVQLVRR